MELYSWAQVVGEFNRLYYETKKNGFVPPDGTSLFDFITLDMMLRGLTNHIGYKFPQDLKSFRSTLSRLKKEQQKVRKRKLNSQIKMISVKRQNRERIKSEELMMEYVNPGETLEEQVRHLGLNPDTYF